MRVIAPLKRVRPYTGQLQCEASLRYLIGHRTTIHLPHNHYQLSRNYFSVCTTEVMTRSGSDRGVGS